jgi:hypothetical protein
MVDGRRRLEDSPRLYEWARRVAEGAKDFPQIGWKGTGKSNFSLVIIRLTFIGGGVNLCAVGFSHAAT